MEHAPLHIFCHLLSLMMGQTVWRVWMKEVPGGNKSNGQLDLAFETSCMWLGNLSAGWQIQSAESLLHALHQPAYHCSIVNHGSACLDSRYSLWKSIHTVESMACN